MLTTVMYLCVLQLPYNMVIPFGSSATAIQTSPTSVEVVVYGEGLVRLNFSKC